ncbi:hypothetical protein C8035_v010246 [Colletotrichum spinosum]|uniref:Uncharacterized protein n=1 Tax=Colletotrichum spinosum TaxID=1347390 RepID=A0A4V3HS90_9PEZI|nr:hypothetical protein C8035_v010246 [Colletotrichum spinosum]
MLRMFANTDGLGGMLMVVIVLLVLAVAASTFNFIFTAGKTKEVDSEGEDDSTYAFYGSKRKRASSQATESLR